MSPLTGQFLMTSISEATKLDTDLDDLLNLHFAGRVVRKDLTKLIKEGANVPVYVLEYLLGNYCASNDQAVIDDTGRWTFDELAAAAARAAGALRGAGVKRGERVAVILPDGRAWCAAFLGAAWLGAVAAPNEPPFQNCGQSGVGLLIRVSFAQRHVTPGPLPRVDSACGTFASFPFPSVKIFSRGCASTVRFPRSPQLLALLAIVRISVALANGAAKTTSIFALSNATRRRWLPKLSSIP